MKRLLAALTVAVAACSQHTAPESVGSSSAALNVPNAIPTPYDHLNGKDIWDGTSVDLMVADAWASCAFANTSSQTPDPDMIVDARRVDAYLSYLAGKMSSTACGAYQQTGNTLSDWYHLRTNLECNSQPGTNLPVAATLPAYSFPSISTDNSFANDATLDADDIIRYAGVNQCIAHQLRTFAPGAAGADALLLSADEQRDLLEITRERAQTAVLQYALLARLFTAPTTSNFPPTALELVQSWAATTASSTGVLQQMGVNFLDAVQLDIVATNDVTQLIARSGSAKLPRGGYPGASLPTEIWGAGSWRLRALAGLYGGDPFVVGYGGSATPAPWAHPDPQPGTLDWLDPAYVDVNTVEPQTLELLNLARRYDALDLKQDTGGIFGHDFSETCLGNTTVDLAGSASRLYRTVEAGLETTECTVQVNSVCQTVTPESIPDPSQGYTNDLVWTRRRITPDHAKVVVSYLAEVMGRICFDDSQSPYEVAGNENVVGGPLGLITRSGIDAGTYYHFNKRSTFESLPVEQRQGAFADYAGVPLPNPVYTDAIDDGQGFDDSVAVQDQHRQLGATVALALTREAIEASNDDITHNGDLAWASDFLSKRVGMLNLIDGAIGNTSTTFTVATQEIATDSNIQVAPVTSGSDTLWHLAFRAPIDDPFWQPNATITIYDAQAPKKAFVMAFRDYVSNMVLHPEIASINGLTIQSVISSVSSTHKCTPTHGTDDTDTASKTQRYSCDLQLEAPSARQGRTVFAVRSDGQTPQYRLIAGPAILRANAPTGHAFTSGGVLNDEGERIVQRLPFDHTVPFYDGFNLPTRLVPSSDPLLAGAGSGSTALSKYLQNAQDSAQSAVAAVTIAFNTLLQEEQSATDAQVKVAQSAQVTQQQFSALCGAAPMAPPAIACDWSNTQTGLFDTNVQNAFNKVAAKAIGCPVQPNDPPPSDPHAALACVILSLFSPFKISVPVATVVYDHLTDQVAPDFAAYNGGTLQKDFIDEWTSITQMRNQLVEVETAWESADAQVLNAENILSAKTQEQQFNCDTATMALSLVEGVSASAGFTPSVSFSPGPLIEQIKKCTDETDQLLAVIDQPMQALAQAMDTMSNETIRLADAAKTLRSAYADTQVAVHQAKLSMHQAEVDADLASSTSLEHQALFRQVHSGDLFRAKSLLESARRYAVIARRAVEARYVVDLSTMNADEPLVASPATWADDVYRYDLNAPAAVGLTVGAAQDTGTTYPNAIVDYVDNLNRFVNGFVIARPSTAVANDTEVLSLPGPTGLVTGNGQLQGAVDGMAFKWQFQCSDGTWVDIPSSGNPDAACTSGSAVLARLTFTLDPWGRVDNGVFSDPFVARYNTRWNRMAVNLVGTAVLDCTKSSDPLACYAQSFVPYSLAHVGPAWVTDYNEAWRLLVLPTSQIEAGKALAAEQWLDPLSNGWSKPYVTAIARTELVDRPFGGAYRLDLLLSPEVVLSRIERVQVLLDYAYWVKEQ